MATKVVALVITLVLIIVDTITSDTLLLGFSDHVLLNLCQNLGFEESFFLSLVPFNVNNFLRSVFFKLNLPLGETSTTHNVW